VIQPGCRRGCSARCCNFCSYRCNRKPVPSSRKGTNNSAAFDLYLKGQGYLRRFNGPPSLDQAVSLLEKAVALDPSYALAPGGTGRSLFQPIRRDQGCSVAGARRCREHPGRTN